MIFYFSGTGNTQWVARQVAEATGETLYDIAEEMREIRKQKENGERPIMTYQLKEDERLGFCFPTHGWQPPRIVREFIRAASFVTNNLQPFCYAITTCGDNMGEAMAILNKELKVKGLEAETLFSVIMPESYVCLPFMHTDSEERVANKMEEARRQMAHICRVIKDRKRGIIELEKGATPRLYSYVIGNYFNKCLITDRKFKVDRDVCTQCGCCAKVCPVQNIEECPPEWLHEDRCTMCLACYHHCPVHAINYGNITRKRGQYVMRED